MTKPQSKPPDATAAAAAVAALEALPLGEAFEPLVDAATEALAEYRDPALQALFPQWISPVSADAIAMYRLVEETYTRSTIVERLIDLHGFSYGSAPELARLIRSQLVAARLRDLMREHARVIDRDRDEYADEVEERFQLAIARQLLEVPEFQAHARVLAVDAPALEATIVACRQRHQAHVQAEAARIEREAAETEALMAEAERTRRRALAERVRRLPPDSVRFSYISPVDGTDREYSPQQAADLVCQPDTSAAFIASIERQLAPFVAFAQSA